MRPLAKTAGALLLLWVLVAGIRSVLDTLHLSIITGPDGYPAYIGDAVSVFGGVLLAIWIAYKVKTAGMTDAEKRDSQSGSSGDDQM
jgi:hypothetical protein